MNHFDAEIPPHVFDQPAPSFDLARVRTPAYVVDLGLLKQNCEKLAMIQREAGVKILLALKGFAMFSTFPVVKQYLSGCCASGLHEALLAHEEFGKEVHVYAPFFKDEEMQQIIPIADHISFNSIAQWKKFRPVLEAAKAKGRAPSPGLRVNPEHGEVEVDLYNPCSPGCRLGTRAYSIAEHDLEGLEGLHFHALCEQGSDVLERVLGAVEKRFPKFIEQAKWINMGGGHHITRKDYDVERLINLLRNFKSRWGKEHVYLEPGEAIGLNTGYLIASVEDIVGQTCVAKSKPSIKLNPKSHEQNQTHPLGRRSGASSEVATSELIACLADSARATDSANAAQRINAETQSLRSWAQGNGWLITESELEARIGHVDVLEGASEHDVFVDAANGYVLKMTKAPNFGARGDAKTYLENITACRALLGIDWRLEGIVEASDGLRFLTSQPYVCGDGASTEEIDSFFTMSGFTKVRENTYQNAEGLTIADARSHNILRETDGTLHFIDVHVLGFPVEESEPSPDEITPTAILDISATAHMPDTLEMPYRPHIIGAGFPKDLPHRYKLGGPTCLAGDVINEYSFPEPLHIGQKLVFTDQAHYTMVKTTTFNGVPHPDIDIYDPETDELRVVRRFGYEDFKRKLS